jgi:hypothetical protein
MIFNKMCEENAMGNEWVDIFTSYDFIETEIIKDLLESGGIPVVPRFSKVTPYPVNIGKMGEIKLFVRKQDKAGAEAMIKETNAE